MSTNNSLDYYSSRNPLNARIAENMLDVTSMQRGFNSFEDTACFCFSKAYGICEELIEKSPVSIWKVPDYYNRTTYYWGFGDLPTIMNAVTISIVLILTEHFEEKWQQDNRKFLEKLKDRLYNLQLSEEKNRNSSSKSICVSAYETLRRDTDIDYVIPFEEFSTQVKNDEPKIIGSEENSITREEIKKIAEDSIKDAFDKRKKEINEKESITNEDIKEAWEQALAKAKAEIESKIPRIEYDEKNEGLRIITGADSHKKGSNESLQDIIKSTVKKYLDEEFEASDADIDEIFTGVYGKELVDRVNRELSEENGNEEADDQRQDYQSPMTITDENLRQQLDEARKTIEEQAKIISDLKSAISEAQQKTLLMSKKKKDRGDIQIGLTREQWIVFGQYLAKKFELQYSNKKQLAPILHALSGWGEKSLSNLTSSYISEDDEIYVASIFGELSPAVAKDICKKWEEKILPPWRTINQE